MKTLKKVLVVTFVMLFVFCNSVSAFAAQNLSQPNEPMGTYYLLDTEAMAAGPGETVYRNIYCPDGYSHYRFEFNFTGLNGAVVYATITHPSGNDANIVNGGTIGSFTSPIVQIAYVSGTYTVELYNEPTTNYGAMLLIRVYGYN